MLGALGNCLLVGTSGSRFYTQKKQRDTEMWCKKSVGRECPIYEPYHPHDTSDHCGKHQQTSLNGITWGDVGG